METEQRHSQTINATSTCVAASMAANRKRRTKVPRNTSRRSRVIATYSHHHHKYLTGSILSVISSNSLQQSANRYNRFATQMCTSITSACMCVPPSFNKLLCFAFLISYVATSSIVQQKADEIFNETNTFARLRSQPENRKNASVNNLNVSQSQSSMAVVISTDGVQQQALNLTLQGGETVTVHLSESGSNTVVNNGTAVNVISKGGWSSSHKV